MKAFYQRIIVWSVIILILIALILYSMTKPGCVLTRIGWLCKKGVEKFRPAPIDKSSSAWTSSGQYYLWKSQQGQIKEELKEMTGDY
jgi:hypothetical protein